MITQIETELPLNPWGKGERVYLVVDPSAQGRRKVWWGPFEQHVPGVYVPVALADAEGHKGLFV